MTTPDASMPHLCHLCLGRMRLTTTLIWFCERCDRDPRTRHPSMRSTTT